MRTPHWVVIQDYLRHFPLPPPADMMSLRHQLPNYLWADAIGVFAMSPIMGVGDRKVTDLPQLAPDVRAAGAALGNYVLCGTSPVPRIFKIGRDFGRDLAGVKADVPPEHLPFDSTVFCIEFPDDMTVDMGDGDFATCAYIGCHRDPGWQDRRMRQAETGDLVEYVLDITVPLVRPGDPGGVPRGQDSIKLFPGSGRNLDDELAKSIAHLRPGGVTGITLELVSYLVNCLLYIHSGDPDLRHLRPAPKPRNAKALKRWRRTSAPVDMVLVGYDYKKPKVYSMDETSVGTFRRWQHYGPRNEQIKLIWVTPFIRHYKPRPPVQAATPAPS